MIANWLWVERKSYIHFIGLEKPEICCVCWYKTHGIWHLALVILLRYTEIFSPPFNNISNISTVWYWHKNKHIGQWNRIGSPEINPSLYGQLIFNKGGRNIKWSKNSLSNNRCWEIWTATWKKMKLNHQLTTYTKINSRWIKDLNISCNTIKVLKENIVRKISDILCSNILTNMYPRARDIKERINKWDLAKIKSFCTVKKNQQNEKGTNCMGKYICKW